MCFPYPRAAQTISGWDTLTTAFQGRTRGLTNKVGAPPGRNGSAVTFPGAPLWCSAGQGGSGWGGGGDTGSMVHPRRVSSDRGTRTEITERQTRAAVTSSRKSPNAEPSRAERTEIPKRHLLFPRAESARSVAPPMNNRRSGVYFGRRQVNVNVAMKCITGRATEEVIDEANVRPLPLKV